MRFARLRFSCAAMLSSHAMRSSSRRTLMLVVPRSPKSKPPGETPAHYAGGPAQQKLDGRRFAHGPRVGNRSPPVSAPRFALQKMESNQAHAQENKWQRSQPNCMRRRGETQIEENHGSKRKSRQDRSQNREDVGIGPTFLCWLERKFRAKVSPSPSPPSVPDG
jgi:hypothetical protein